MSMFLKNKILHITFLLFLPLMNCIAQQDTISMSSMDERAELFIDLDKTTTKLESVFSEIIYFLNSIGNQDSLNYLDYITNSQKYWEIHSEFECKFIEFETRNGTQGGLPFYNQCKIEMNNERSEKLSEILANLKREFED